MKTLLATLGVASLLATPAAFAATEMDEGEIEEITITIKTDEETKTLTVDEDVDLDDIAIGKKVKVVFDEDTETIEFINVLDDDD